MKIYKKTFLVLGFCGLFANSFAQTTPAANNAKQTIMPGDYVKGHTQLYWGFGSGINNLTGVIGLRLDAVISEKIMLSAGAGFGGWGYKLSLSGIYRTKSNWNPMIGVARATGIDAIPLKLEVMEGGYTRNRDVTVELRPVTTLNFGVEKQWFTKKGNRIYIDLGYSLSGFESPLFTIKTPGVVVTEDGKNSIRVISPGGLILGAGIAFHL
jgi:hypothetical protein